jgi:hypothetical protein
MTPNTTAIWGYATRAIGGPFGVPRGTVERFSVARGSELLMDGAIERFDPPNERHQKAPGAECIPEDLRKPKGSRREK